ncbi:MAG: diaminopimelate epimerase [Nitrospirae bacterium]|nr:diaminopimelate epimerase [Nitrospirota bacterium]
MKLQFTKMHGSGNDFILINAIHQEALPPLAPFCKTYSDRKFGIGFDQALILRPSKAADFKMEIFNADGSQVEMCGNGIRCLAKYIWDRGLSDKRELMIETLAGVIRPVKEGDLIRVDMGEPIFDAPSIPVNLEGEVRGYALKALDREFLITCVSMGNPHAVIFVEDLQSFPLEKYGPVIENHPLFPKRTNVEFVRIIQNPSFPPLLKGGEGGLNEAVSEIQVRVWERGAGETLACGTGACASAVAAHVNGLTDRKVTVHLAGGDLLIHWSDKDNHVYMTGPAVEVYSGEMDIVSSDTKKVRSIMTFRHSRGSGNPE